MKKLMALLMTLAMMSTFSCTALAANESDVGGTSFEPKGGDGKVRIGVISDTHIYSEATAEVFENALRAFKTVADDGQGNIDLSGLLLNGDIVYQFTPGVTECTSVTDVIYNYVQSKIDAQFPNGAPETVWVMGDNEFPQATNDATLTAEAETYFKDKTDCYGEDLDNSDEIRYVSQFGAYTVITAAAENFWGALSAETEAWILETIAEEVKAYPTRPIFLALHHPLDGTVYGSEASVSASNEFIERLKDYPQVINITSHIHPAPQNPMTIYQAVKETETGVSGFTSVCTPYTGSTGYLNVEGTSQTSSPNFAMMIEIDEMNVVSIYKMDLTTGKYVGEPWVIDVPALVEGNAEDYHYTNARIDNSNTPVFPANASLAVSEVSNSGAVITFAQATNEKQDAYAQDGFVEYYKAEVYNTKTGMPATEINIPSGYQFADVVGEMPDEVSGTLSDLSFSTPYTVKVYPVSPFGKKGEPIEASFSTVGYHEIPGEGILSLSALNDNLATEGDVTELGSSVAFRRGTVDFEVYAPETGWYDVGINATRWDAGNAVFGVIMNNVHVNDITVSQTGEWHGVVEDYFANPTDFWNTPGSDSYGLGAGYGAEQTVVLPHENHVWLYEGKNIIQFENATDAVIGFHSAIFRKVNDCTDIPDNAHLYACSDYKIAYKGYGTVHRTSGMDIAGPANGVYIGVTPDSQLAAYEVAAPVAGYYNLTLHYGLQENTGNTTFDVYINADSKKELESVICESTGAGYDYYGKKEMGRVYLNEGINLLTFTQTGATMFFLHFTLQLDEAKMLPQAGKTTLPVMMATAFNTSTGTNLPYDDDIVDTMSFGGGAWVEYTVNIAEAGKYNFMRKGAAYETGLYTVYVNGEQQLQAANPSYDEFLGEFRRGEDKLGELYLNKGKNVIKVANSVSQAFIDNITLARADAKMYISGDCVSEVASGDITAKMALNGDMAVGSKANCIFAIYEDGKLVGIDSESKVLETLYDEFTATISGVTVQNDKTYTAKAFLWNDSYNGKQIVLDAE